ncbi:YceI family protein [Neptunicella marina]|uniref:YceI family protein n=1 Tax=Neptunicella marina TaxID=2125989 RepID=A0A8J6M068_9ALTE|nr:YceI family protein [Neptunicella marina]MBC3764707.1 YceI family protein [Neptunicella marina]
MKKLLLASALLAASQVATAADYKIDTDGAHAFIQFKVSHLGYSYVMGRFNKFDGQFSWDADKPEASKITVNIDTTSVDSNHAKRDKHISSPDFLNVDKFATAKFVSTKVEEVGDGELTVTGNLTLLGVTKEIQIDVSKIGEGDDPWGGYRAGFEGTTSIQMGDFGTKMDFGTVDFNLVLEGIRQ